MYRAITLVCVLTLAGLVCLAGSATDLGSNSALGINNGGRIVGYYYTEGGLTKHALLREILIIAGAPGFYEVNMLNLGTLLGDVCPFDKQQRAGCRLVRPANAEDAQSGLPFHAFLYSGGRMMSLGTLGRNTSYARAINDSGQIVGSSYTASGGSVQITLSAGC